MQRRFFLRSCLCLSLIGVFGSIQTALAKHKKVDPNGWVWKFTATSRNDQQSGTFRIRNHEIFKNEKKVGHVDPLGGTGLGDKVVLTLTDLGNLNGQVLLEKTHAKPPVWVGTLKTKDGTEWEFKAKLVTKK
jgi:hypothetical protein